MNKIAQLFVAGSFLRYTLLLLALLVASGLSWIGFLRSDEPFYRPDVPALAYLIATPIWIVFAVLDRRRLVWRLLLIWAPPTPVFLIMLHIVLFPATAKWELDGQAMAMSVYMLIFAGMAVLSGLGTAAVLIYRPGKGSLRPS